MNMQKFTEKSVQAVQDAQNIAARQSNQAIGQEHLLSALCLDDNGLIPQLLTQMSTDINAFRGALDRAVDKIPKVTVGGRAQGQVYISSELDRALAIPSLGLNLQTAEVQLELVANGIIRRTCRRGIGITQQAT